MCDKFVISKFSCISSDTFVLSPKIKPLISPCSSSSLNNSSVFSFIFLDKSLIFFTIKFPLFFSKTSIFSTSITPIIPINFK